MDLLGEHGVAAQTIEGLTGIWVQDDRRRASKRTMSPLAGPSARKIGSIGVHVSRGVTTHGLAINVNNDLQPFEWIVPCGIEGCRVTSLSRERGAEQDLGAFADTLVARFAEVYGREPVETDPAELGLPAASLGSPS
jgi:lipoyl(octanoyl) transferase